MATLRVEPRSSGAFAGRLRVPSDKSMTQRALLLSAIAEGTSRVRAPLDAGDTRSVRGAIERLGARVVVHGPDLAITGSPRLALKGPSPLDLENSGTGARLLLGLLAGQQVAATITGDESLRRRPMGRVVRPLTAMGARFNGADRDRLPLTLVPTARLRPFVGELDVASAQVKSAVLLAALHAEGLTRLREPAPTRAHTERMLPLFGATICTDGGTIGLEGPQRLRATELAVPADPSSAAFHAAATALFPGARATFSELLLSPRRTAFFTLLSRMGATVATRPTGVACGEPIGEITVTGGELRAVAIAPEEVPDLIDELPLVAVLGACAEGATWVAGAAELRLKESDRIGAIGAGLAAMGARFEPRPDGFVVQGGKLHGATVASCADHRIAMALTVAALRADGASAITGFECAAVSYPSFLDDLAALLGASPGGYVPDAAGEGGTGSGG